MANTNKVEFGLSGVHVGTYTVDTDGTATLGVGEAIKGAVSLTAEAQSSSNSFYADNIKFYDFFSESGDTGEMVMANFPDSFKEKYLGYKRLSDGGLARVKNPQPVPFWIAFEGEGDAKKRRHVLLNLTAGQIKREHKTNTENVEVEVETLPISVTGDNKSGFIKLSYSEGETGYSTALTAPTIPAVVVTP